MIQIETVLDTSVIIKWFCQKEILADHALTIRNEYLSGRIRVSIPALMVYELANVLRYKIELKTDEVGEAITSLLNMGFDIIMPSKHLMDRAISVARTYDITVYDSSFLALAESFNAFFITADKQLCEQLHDFPSVRFLELVNKIL